MGPAACNTEIGILRVACQGGHPGRRLGCLEFSSMGSGGEQARTPANSEGTGMGRRGTEGPAWLWRVNSVGD